MNLDDVPGVLAFLQHAADLKDTLRSGYTPQGRPEDVAGHSWRVGLLAATVAPAFPEVDPARLLKMCLIHDLGEIIGGDIPAPDQVGRPDKSAQERRDFQTVTAPLPAPIRQEFLELWDEYEAAITPTAKVAKAVDKLETLSQQAHAKLPAEFDLAWNLGYARKHTTGHPLIESMRAQLDAETRAEVDRRNGKSA